MSFLSPSLSTGACLALTVWLCFPRVLPAEVPTTLPGMAPLTQEGNLSEQMHLAALAGMEGRIADSLRTRAQYWHRDFASPQAYELSIHDNRERLRKIIGVVDPRLSVEMERFGTDEAPALIAETDGYRAWQVRWPVLAGVTGEGLLLEPKTPPRAWVIALPDADQTPEQIAGLQAGVPAESQFARRLVENGLGVIVPTLIDRGTAGSGNPAVAMTNQPHREWLYRQACLMGRHPIGYEVQKVLAAVDWLSARQQTVIGVAGYGEGGLIAFYAAAVDPRLRAALVSGYFKSRQGLWAEPLYRNVWGLLREFGDAEIASLIAPRGLVIEHSAEPHVDGPPPAAAGGKSTAAPGRLVTPPLAEIRAELARLDSLLPSQWQPRRLIGGEQDSPVPPGSQTACAALAGMLGVEAGMPLSPEAPSDRRRAFDPLARQGRQVKEIENHAQALRRVSEQTRNESFLYRLLPKLRDERWTYARFAPLDPAPFIAAAKPYRQLFWEEVVGKIDEPLPPPQPRTRRIYDEPKWTGYEVTLDLGGEEFAWGVLLLPKDLQPGEKRPVVVCQHGRHGVPADVIDTHKEAYHDFAARLAERGFIVLAPHGLFGLEPLYRQLSREGNTVKASIFSVILRHHEQWLRWLETLPHVDAQRIAFYGLSYGGKTAMRVPPLLDRYCLCICSGDFNDWPRKVASLDDRRSFMFTDEYEVFEFNLGNTFSYAELTYLMFPRPFMVERGHHDGVAADSWVASEYAKTRWLYTQFGLADQTEIEFFNGGHTINGQGTFSFLHRHLGWPEPKGEK